VTFPSFGFNFPFRDRRLSVAQRQLQDYAGGDRNQDIVGARLYPMVAAGRRAEMVAVPVVDHILLVAVFGRQALPALKVVVRACAAYVASLVVLRATVVVALVLLALALHLVIATAVIAIAITLTLGERGSSRGQKHRHDGGHNHCSFHPELHSVG